MLPHSLSIKPLLQQLLLDLLHYDRPHDQERLKFPVLQVEILFVLDHHLPLLHLVGEELVLSTALDADHSALRVAV